MRAVSVAFSPARRLAAEEGAGDLARGVVLLLDVDRQGKEVHVAQVADGGGARTMVSPLRTTTAPPAWRASLPVSKVISPAPTSTETRLTSNILMNSVVSFRPPGWRPFFSELSFSNGAMVHDAPSARLIGRPSGAGRGPPRGRGNGRRRSAPGSGAGGGAGRPASAGRGGSGGPCCACAGAR